MQIEYTFAMISKNEILDFAAFCFSKYGLHIRELIVEDYIQSNSSASQSGNNVFTAKNYETDECGSNNISCTHVTIDSARCNKCPY